MKWDLNSSSSSPQYYKGDLMLCMHRDEEREREGCYTCIKMRRDKGEKRDKKSDHATLTYFTVTPSNSEERGLYLGQKGGRC